MAEYTFYISTTGYAWAYVEADTEEEAWTKAAQADWVDEQEIEWSLDEVLRLEED